MISCFRPIARDGDHRGWLALTAFALWGALASPAIAAPEDEPFRRTITSAVRSERVETLEISSRSFPGVGTAAWSIRKRTLHGGKQEGVELVDIDNGRLSITVIPTRGMNILEARQGDFRLGWLSPVQEVVHPQFIRLDTRGGLGWLEGFNELLVRCGLEFAGHPGRDQFVDNTGAKNEMDLTLHGKIGNIPASEVEVLIDRREPFRLRLRGVVYERSFYGPKLELATEVSTVPGSDSFRVEDTITNRGGQDQEFEVIYHANFGRPLLEPGAKVVAALDQLAPMNVHASKAIDQYAVYAAPTPGFIEEVYLGQPRADAQGSTSILLRNAAGDRGASLSWSTAELPYLTIWKNTAAEADGYVTGLEPGTGFPFNRRVERAGGRLPKLTPGQSRTFTINWGLHLTSEAVTEVEKRIAAIQGGQPPVLEHTPPEAAP
jgi:hypothetical protein